MGAMDDGLSVNGATTETTEFGSETQSAATKHREIVAAALKGDNTLANVEGLVKSIDGLHAVDHKVITSLASVVEQDSEKGINLLVALGDGKVSGRGLTGSRRDKILISAISVIRDNDLTQKQMDDLIYLSTTDEDSDPTSIMKLIKRGMTFSQISAMQEAGKSVDGEAKQSASRVLWASLDETGQDLLMEVAAELASTFGEGKKTDSIIETLSRYLRTSTATDILKFLLQVKEGDTRALEICKVLGVYNSESESEAAE